MNLKGHHDESKQDVSRDVNSKGEGDDFVFDTQGNVCTARDCGAPPWFKFWLCALKSNARPTGSGASGHGGCTVSRALSCSTAYCISHAFNTAGIFGKCPA